MHITGVWILLLLFSLPAAAQSVAGVAGKTRRQKITKESKVYTNNDLNSSKGNVTSTATPRKAADGPNSGSSTGQDSGPETTPAGPQKTGSSFSPQDRLNWEYYQRIKELTGKYFELQREIEEGSAKQSSEGIILFYEQYGYYPKGRTPTRSGLEKMWKEMLRTGEELEQAKREARQKNVPPAYRELRKAPPAPPGEPVQK